MRAVLVAGGLAVTGVWWRDTIAGTLRGFGPELTAGGRVLGLLGAYLVLVQLLLMARLPWFERSVGFDRLAAWHRGLGTNTVVLLSAHVLLILWGHAVTRNAPVPTTVWHIVTTYPDMLAATAGLAVFLLVAVSSARRARRRLSYEAWYWLHLSAYAATALAFSHQLSNGADFVHHPLNLLLWKALYAIVLGCLVGWRVVLPARVWWRHRLRVDRVVHEGPGVVSVWIRGHRLDLLGAKAGQFLLWRFLAPGHVWTAHPYSLSAAPRRSLLRITVKAAGDHSADLGRLRAGTPVMAEGPFGRFTAERRGRHRVLLVAGGSGIGPIRALAESFAHPGAVDGGPGGPDVVLLYRASRPVDLVLREELDAMAASGGLSVRYIIGRRVDQPSDPLSTSALAALVPDARHRDVYVCGPAGMTQAVLANLRRLGVPRRHLHAEEFIL